MEYKVWVFELVHLCKLRLGKKNKFSGITISPPPQVICQIFFILFAVWCKYLDYRFGPVEKYNPLIALSLWELEDLKMDQAVVLATPKK